ncbi:MAG: aminotransferase class I/II-fold pyridoxal phosphate-dependent enzyme [Proteobacteria bacterium]|nr:aminotransferase class I/II-fold pyridoxal phosphate-dependent enzyme [Pseudomonadota bacterium]
MLNDRFEKLGEGPFQRLRSLLADVAPPKDRAPIVMAIGEPRHPYPDFVGDVLNRERGSWGGYPPTTGTPEYRQATAAWATRRYHLPEGMLDPDRHIVPLSGTREGLFLIALTVVPQAKAGGVPLVLMPNPFYHCYAGAAVAAGGEPRYLPATRENGFLPDFSSLSETELARTALVYLCSPANPQGSVAKLDYLKQVIALARAYDFVVVVDECYAEIYLDDPPPGVLQACAELGDDFTKVLAFHSLSKRSSTPGLRCGFAAGDPYLIERFVAFRNYGCAQVPLPVYAAGTALWRDEAHVEANRALYRVKFDAAEEILGGHYGFFRPQGAFFLWLDVGDGEAATRELWARGAIRTLPGGYLTRDTGAAPNPGNAYIRVALVNDLEITREALLGIRSIL